MEFQWSELIWPFDYVSLFQELNTNNSKIEFLLPKYNEEGREDARHIK